MFYLKLRETVSELITAFGDNSKERTHISECIFNSDAWEIQLKTVKAQVFPTWVPFAYERIV